MLYGPYPQPTQAQDQPRYKKGQERDPRRHRHEVPQGPEHLFEQGIAALEKWFDKIGTPTRLSQLGITEDDLPATIENVLGNASYFGVADIYTKDVVTTILKSAL